MTILCTFTSLEDLFPIDKRGTGRRRRGITDADVLRLLDKVRRFSCFESNSALACVNALQVRGLIDCDPGRHAYPWIAVELTDAGRALLGSGGEGER